MTAPSIETMSIDELEALKQQIEEGIQAKKQQRVEEAFQKINYLDENDLRGLISRIQDHLKPKIDFDPYNPYKGMNTLQVMDQFSGYGT